jgi:hypothetical protein
MAILLVVVGIGLPIYGWWHCHTVTTSLEANLHEKRERMKADRENRRREQRELEEREKREHVYGEIDWEEIAQERALEKEYARTDALHDHTVMLYNTYLLIGLGRFARASWF